MTSCGSRPVVYLRDTGAGNPMVEAMAAPVCSLCSRPIATLPSPEAASAAAWRLSAKAALASASLLLASSFCCGASFLVAALSRGMPMSATTAAVAALYQIQQDIRPFPSVLTISGQQYTLPRFHTIVCLQTFLIAALIKRNCTVQNDFEMGKVPVESPSCPPNLQDMADIFCSVTTYLS